MSTKKDLTRREFVAGAGKATLSAMVAASGPLACLHGSYLEKAQ